MKILLINAVCGVTSTGRICGDIADLAERAGHECKIAYARGNVPERYKKYAMKFGNTADVYAHALLSRLSGKTGFYSLQSTKKLIRQIEEYNPDVIHLHNIHGYYINIKVLFSYLKRAKKPVVWTFHDCWPFTGQCTYFDFSGCEKWKTKCENCTLIHEYPQSFIDRSSKNYREKLEIFNSIDNIHIVTPSKWLAELVKQSFLNKHSVHVIPNGVDLSVFSPKANAFKNKHGLENKKILLGVANIWAARKGISDLFKLNDMLDEQYKLVLVGDLKGQSVPENVLYIPHTDSVEELAEIYTSADFFVNPTYEDNFPTTNLESLACG
ncbi:MAG: glycosyltransferase, partial [Clostridia bacterium]|nr:glycosyltransferase [Clostridia bacterium]